MKRVPILLLVGVAAVAPGCVRREMTIVSDPPGALVFLNDQEVGRTPLTRPFTFYGTYDVQVRLDDYETVRTKTLVLAPWWQWVPFDFAAEFLPLTDRHTLKYTLTPASTRPADPTVLLGNAAQLQAELRRGFSNPEDARRSTTSPTTTQP